MRVRGRRLTGCVCRPVPPLVPVVPWRLPAPLPTEDSFDLYYGLYKYNPAARTELDRLEASFAAIRARLDACEAAEAADAADAAAAAADKPGSTAAAAADKADAPAPAADKAAAVAAADAPNGGAAKLRAAV